MESLAIDIIAIVGKIIERDLSNVSWDENLEINSIDMVEVIIALEKHFGIEIPDEELLRPNTFTLSSLENLISSYLE